MQMRLKLNIKTMNDGWQNLYKVKDFLMASEEIVSDLYRVSKNVFVPKNVFLGVFQ